MKLCQNVRTVSHTLLLKCKIVLLQLLLEIILFAYLCSGSSLLHRAFLVGVSRGYSVVVVCGLLTAVTSRCRARVPGREGFSSCGFPALEHMGLVFPWHMGSSRIRAWTRVFCPGRWTLYHWAFREALSFFHLSCNAVSLLFTQENRMPSSLQNFVHKRS